MKILEAEPKIQPLVLFEKVVIVDHHDLMKMCDFKIVIFLFTRKFKTFGLV